LLPLRGDGLIESMGSQSRTVSSQRLLPLTVVGLIVGVPMATWGLISPAEFPYENPDYLVELDVSPGARLLTGVIAAVVVVLVGVLVPVVAALRSDAATGGWWARVVVPLVMSGVLTGWTVHFATAPVIGASIGGGLMVMFVLPVALALLIWGLHSAMRPLPKAKE
jgi:hypothetical protein